MTKFLKNTPDVKSKDAKKIRFTTEVGSKKHPQNPRNLPQIDGFGVKIGDFRPKNKEKGGARRASQTPWILETFVQQTIAQSTAKEVSNGSATER